MPRAAPPATADDGSSTAAAPEPSMTGTSVSMDVVTDPSPVNTESAGVEDAESSQGGESYTLPLVHRAEYTQSEKALKRYQYSYHNPSTLRHWPWPKPLS